MTVTAAICENGHHVKQTSFSLVRSASKYQEEMTLDKDYDGEATSARREGVRLILHTPS
jgi:hypothetical protein